MEASGPAALALLALLAEGGPQSRVPGATAPELRWVSGDTHVHTSGCLPQRQPAELLDLLALDGIDVAAALVWGKGFERDRPQFSGEDHPASRPGRILHYDLEVSEFPAARMGHLVLLGLQSIDFAESPFETPLSGVPILEWARAQGPRVLAGMAHGQFWPADGRFPVPEDGCCIPFEFPVHVARGRMDFLETERRGRGPAVDGGTLDLWTLLLDAGFRVPLAGASDLPCLRDPRDAQTPRTDVLVEGELSYAAWLDGLRKGRSVVVTGSDNHLDLRIDGARLGDEVHAVRGEVVEAVIESRFPQGGDVTLLANGAPVATVTMEPGARTAALPLVASSSFWVAAHSAKATTSPVYVLVDERPIRASAESACRLVRYVDHLSGLVRAGRLPLGGQQAEVLAAYDEARRELLRRFTEAGGQACP